MAEGLNHEEPSLPEIMKRPSGQLLAMPPVVRWEVTRRHPYYLLCWEKAWKYHCEPAASDPYEQLMRYAAMAMLNLIGISGSPVDPATPAQVALGPSCDFMGPSGSVQPMTFRTMARMLIQCLPRAERICLASIFQVSASSEYAQTGDDESQLRQRQIALVELARLKSPPLDSFAETSLFYIHPEASQRTVQSDLAVVMGKLKKQRGIPEKRLGLNKFKKCLAVWDLREGWMGGGYDMTKEVELRHIAQRLRTPVSTVFSRYKMAFELITGHSFETSLWLRLLARFKFAQADVDYGDRILRRYGRRLQTLGRAHVTQGDALGSETSLGTEVPDDVTIRHASFASAAPDVTADHDLLIDADELVGLGWSDDAIQQELGQLPVEFLSYVRGRINEPSR